MPPEQIKILEFFKTDPVGDRVNFIDMISPLSGPMELQLSVLDVIDKVGSTRDIFFIYHMEECIYQSKIDAKDFFNRLNLIRDFFGRFRAVFVFFMTESLVKTMIRHAFDFYDWMKLTFEFHPESELALPQIMDTDIPWRKKYSDIDKKIKYLENSLKLIKNEKEQLLRLLDLGSLYAQVYRYDKALEYFNSAEEIASRLGDKEGLSEGLSGEGYIFRIRGDYTAALEKYEGSLKIREEIGDRLGIAQTKGQLGLLFQATGKYPEAFEYLLTALAIFTELQSPDAEKTLRNLGKLRDDWGEEAFEEAFEEKRKRRRAEERKRESTVGANPRVRPFIDQGLWPYQ